MDLSSNSFSLQSIGSPVKQPNKVEDSPDPPVPGGFIDEGQGHPDEAIFLLPAEDRVLPAFIPVANLTVLPEPLVECFIPHLETEWVTDSGRHSRVERLTDGVSGTGRNLATWDTLLCRSSL